MINNAERCFFADHKTDSAFAYFDSAFTKFDFAFARDCFMAAQIAYYRRDKRYTNYLRKGFRSGLQPAHLRYSPILSPLANSTRFAKLFPDYKELRKKYLSGISPRILKTIIEHVCADQSEKNQHHMDNAYAQTLLPHIAFIQTLIRSGYFPGEKLIGIDQPDIMQELGYDSSDYMDLYNTRYHLPQYHTVASQFESCMECISQDHVTPLLLHHPCSVYTFSSYWDKLIANGQLYPRTFAYINDHWFSKRQTFSPPSAFNCYDYRPKMCFGVNPFSDYSPNISHESIDSLRKHYYVPSLATDWAIKQYEKDSGFFIPQPFYVMIHERETGEAKK